MSWDTPTTRRHPRTTGEAFKDASYADPIYRPQDGENRNGWAGVVLAIVIGLVGALVLVIELSRH